MSKAFSLANHRGMAGMSIIEILVGMAIGVIGILAIFQVTAVWNRHTQTTSAGGDAQVAGTLALFNLERDLKQAGHGFGEAPVAVMGCDVQAFDTEWRGAAFNFRLRPIDIIVGAGGGPDQINVLYGNSSFFVEGQDFLASTATAKTLRRRGGFKMGDLVVIADAGLGAPGSAVCNLAEITADTDPDLLTVDHLKTVLYTPFVGPAKPSRFDVPGGIPGYVSGTLYNLGPRPQRFSWQIGNSRTLQKSELIFSETAVPVPADIADGVVNMKAEYGIDLNGDTRIDPAEWLPAIPAAPNNDWKQVLAVRVAILVRSKQFEQSRDPAAGVPVPVTTVAPTYFDNTAAHTFVMTNVNGTADTFAGTPTAADPNNWRYYRYRVYERVIPLKNMLWALP